MSANDRQVAGNHYAGEYQHWDMCADADLRHQESAASKYLARYDLKGHPIVDLEKSKHYVEKLRELVAQGRRNPQQRAMTALETMRHYCNANGFGSRKREALYYLATWRNPGDLRDLELLIDEMIRSSDLKTPA